MCSGRDSTLECLAYLKEIRQPGCIITDVGSVKGIIHQKVDELGMTDCFIGGHPMAGSEKTGFDHSNERILENAYYILTPGGEVGLEYISDFTELISSLGAIPMVLTAEEHDFITAGVSHLPHIIASALVNLVKNPRQRCRIHEDHRSRRFPRYYKDCLFFSCYVAADLHGKS